MNYDTITASAFTAIARITDAYNAAQDWIANEAPVVEQRIRRTALRAAVNLLPLIILAIDFLRDQLDRVPEYQIKVRLYSVRARLFVARKVAAVVQSPVAATALKVWTNRSAVTRKALDAVFCLD
ncbi:MAG: hypothetical protein WA949_12875 [Phormidesmis sp.]